MLQHLMICQSVFYLVCRCAVLRNRIVSYVLSVTGLGAAAVKLPLGL